MIMPCGNTQAEIDRDTQTDSQEQAQYAADQERWKLYVDQLLEGVTVEENGREYRLADRMADEYQEFADKIDSDIDFMAEFKNGEYGARLNSVFKQEARTLASIIAGA